MSCNNKKNITFCRPIKRQCFWKKHQWWFNKMLPSSMQYVAISALINMKHFWHFQKLPKKYSILHRATSFFFLILHCVRSKTLRYLVRGHLEGKTIHIYDKWLLFGIILLLMIIDLDSNIGSPKKINTKKPVIKNNTIRFIMFQSTTHF